MSNQFGVWARRGCVAAGRGLVLFGLSLLAGVLAVGLAVAVGSIVWVLLVPATVVAIRRLANRSRYLAGAWSAVEIPMPYRPSPPMDSGAKGWWQRLSWIFTDPATWQDLRWLLVAPIVSASVAVLPAAVIAYGLFGLVQPAVWKPIVHTGSINWYGMIPVTDLITAWSAAVLGVGIVLLGLAIGPWALRTHAHCTHWLLAPTTDGDLTRRVRHLTETRSDAVDAQSAELRRSERDLHDGAQARLVAVGMILSATEQLLDENPPAARSLLGEARQASAKALDELRDHLHQARLAALRRRQPSSTSSVGLPQPLTAADRAHP